MKPARLLLVVSLICLNACATARFDGSLSALEAGSLSACPAVAEYSSRFQGELAAELEAMATGKPAIWRALLDYGELRAAVRACRGPKSVRPA